jgi:hypothetical protein
LKGVTHSFFGNIAILVQCILHVNELCFWVESGEHFLVTVFASRYCSGFCWFWEIFDIDLFLWIRILTTTVVATPKKRANSRISFIFVLESTFYSTVCFYSQCSEKSEKISIPILGFQKYRFRFRFQDPKKYRLSILFDSNENLKIPQIVVKIFRWLSEY